MLRVAYLDLDEVRLAQGDELSIGFQFLYVPGLNQGQAVYCALLLQKARHEQRGIFKKTNMQ